MSYTKMKTLLCLGSLYLLSCAVARAEASALSGVSTLLNTAACISSLKQLNDACYQTRNQLAQVAHSHILAAVKAEELPSFREVATSVVADALASNLKAPAACCHAMQDVLTAAFQEACAVQPAVARWTKRESKDMMDLYTSFAQHSCNFTAQASWHPAGLDTASVLESVRVKAADMGRAGQENGRMEGQEHSMDFQERAHSSRAMLQTACTQNGYDSYQCVQTTPFFRPSCPSNRGYCSTGGTACNNGYAGFCPGDVYFPCASGQTAFCCYVLQCSCFPGDATVTLESGASRRMSELAVGDKVKAVSAQGKVTYEEVYFFGHQEADVKATFVVVTLEGGNHTLELTAGHFLPAVPQGKQPLWSNTVHVRGKDITPGMVIFVAQGTTMVPFEVAAVHTVSKLGIYNPYTLGGRIVVNNVVASSHSEWVLDGVLDSLGAPHLLPALYQLLFTPLRLAYHALGPALMARVGPAIAELGNAALGMQLALPSLERVLVVAPVAVLGWCVMSAQGKRVAA